jgi:hypothetical protein
MDADLGQTEAKEEAQRQDQLKHMEGRAERPGKTTKPKKGP